MRKILLATTALVGLVAASAAHAAPASPLTVNVGGDVDFLAGFFHEASKTSGTTADRTADDFETLYDLDFSVNGKSGNGVQYGGILSMNNTPDIVNNLNGQGSGLDITAANIFMSGAFGKVQLGDSHGATDLALMAPTVGEGQVDGRYIDFLDSNTFGKTMVLGIDSIDHSTNVTYFTPKVGNDTNKVQAAVSYVPNFYNYGSNVVQISNASASGGNHDTLSPYKDVIKGAVAYNGTFAPVAIAASAHIITGTSDQNPAGISLGSGTASWVSNAPTAAGAGGFQDFTSWGVGLQGALEGFTLGATYTDLGHYDAVASQSKSQNQYSAGLKYEFSKYAVGVSYLGGEGYDNMLALATGTGTGSSFNYIKDFDTEGLGGSYAWAPGLTTNVDGTLFQQEMETGSKNDGYVLLVSQKLAF